MSPHPRFNEFYAKLQDCTYFKPWNGDGYRAGLPKWMSRPYRLTGVGAVITGGRFNSRQLIPAVYFATTAETLAAEADQEAIRYGWQPAHLQPQTRIVARISLQAVLNLTEPAVLAHLNVTADDLRDCDWRADQSQDREALTQAIARAVFELGGEGLIAPSAQHPGGTNLVYFDNNARPDSTIAWYGEENIPFVHGL